jgi:hypothetical protein
VRTQDVQDWFDQLKGLLHTDGPIDGPPGSPILLVHLGVETKAKSIKLESTAWNNADFRIPDGASLIPGISLRRHSPHAMKGPHPCLQSEAGNPAINP